MHGWRRRISLLHAFTSAVAQVMCLFTVVGMAFAHAGAAEVDAQGVHAHLDCTPGISYSFALSDTSASIHEDTSTTARREQIAHRWSQMPVTRVAYGSKSLTIDPVDHSREQLERQVFDDFWLPLLVCSPAPPEPEISVTIFEYTYVRPAECSSHYIDGEWREVCVPAETHYIFTVQVPQIVTSMWMVQLNEEGGREHIKMWRSWAAEQGFFHYRRPFYGSTMVLPLGFEHTAKGEMKYVPYDPDCLWYHDEPMPSCWTAPIPN